MMNAKELWREWLDDFGGDPAVEQELRAIENDDAEITDRFGKELEFGTAGMRGVIGMGTNRINVYNVRRVTRAFAKYILTVESAKDAGVVIAYDSRNFSDVFAKNAALVLCANGIKVYLFESLRPVPVLSFSVRYLKCVAGICITASHNPAQYNGYKVYWTDGGQMPPESVKGLTDRLPETTYRESVPMDEKAAVDAGLLRYVGSEIDDAFIGNEKRYMIDPSLVEEMGEKLRIVYSPLNGTGNVPVRRLLSEIGFKNVYVVPEQEYPDGNFPTLRVPNPEDPAAFTLALAMQKELGADLCIATDPDCDRVGVACLQPDGSVKLLNGNQIGCVLLDYILTANIRRGTLPENGACVSTIVSTGMAKKIAEVNGVKYVAVLTGFKYIAEKIKQFEENGSYHFLFGFEESNGYLSCTEVRDKDGVNAVMLLAEAAAWYRKQGMTLTDAIELLYKKYGFYGDKAQSFAFPGIDGNARMKSVMQSIRQTPPVSLGGKKVLAVRDYLTGLRTAGDEVTCLDLPESNVLYYELEDDAWACIRPSGTEPKLKVYVNAVSGSHKETDEALKAILGDVENIIRSMP